MNKFYAFVHSTHPCTELVLDMKKIEGYLDKAGYSKIEEVGRADLVVISTCAFDQHYEDDGVDLIEGVKKDMKEGAKVVVAGCLSKINPQRFEEVCDFTPLAPREMEKLEEIVPSDTPLDSISAHLVSIKEYEQNSLFMTGIRLKKLFRALPFIEPPSWLDTVPMTDWFFVRAATGCAGTCSYCAIKRALWACDFRTR